MRNSATTWIRVAMFGTVLALPAGAADAPKSEKAQADELFASARAHRLVWDEKFPGFSAVIEVAQNGQHAKGTVAVDREGKATVKLEGADDKLHALVQRAIDSMAGHRLAATAKPETGRTVRFAKDDPANHAAGVLVEAVDDDMHSSYRLKDNQIMVVNRKMGPLDMTITVVRNELLPGGKYLPGDYTVNMWDKEGRLVSSTSVHEEWTVVSGYQLPKATTSVTAGNDKNWNVTTLRFSNHSLATPETSAAR